MNEMRKLMEAVGKINEDYTSRDVRKTTNKLLELMDEGSMDPRSIADAALSYMSESEVHDMARANDWLDGMYGDDDSNDEDEFEESVTVIGEDSGNQDIADQLAEIQEEMLSLLEQASDLVRGTDEWNAAKSYWLAHIAMGLTNDHEYMGSGGHSMQDTIEALQEEDDEDDGSIEYAARINGIR